LLKVKKEESINPILLLPSKRIKYHASGHLLTYGYNICLLLNLFKITILDKLRCNAFIEEKNEERI